MLYAGNLTACFAFVKFSKIFNSVHCKTLAVILCAYGISQETIDVIMILYKNTQSMDSDFDAAFYKIDTLTPLLFILALDYILRTSVDLKKN